MSHHRPLLRLRAERRAAPKPARVPMGDRPRYAAGEGQTHPAERRAAPEPARVPSGDRARYSADEGLS